MNVCRLAILFTLVALLTISDARKKKSPRRSKRNHVSCRPAYLVRYRLTIHTLWSKRVFPKMFPTYRPHAQWSELIGRTHGPDYRMWAEGKNATLGVKAFAEDGDPSYLDLEGVQGYGNVLDTFTAPQINRSVGQSSAIILLDGRHSLISFMMKLIPSPDWFIGVSGLDLCAHGRWKKTVHTNLRPMDAGTDRGLTFTSPNWPNDPPEPVYAITSSYPDHQASSFFYTQYETLPRIAYVDLELVSEYRHRRTFVEVPLHFNTSTTDSAADEDTEALATVETDNLEITTAKPARKVSEVPAKDLGNELSDADATTSSKDETSNNFAVDDTANRGTVQSKANAKTKENPLNISERRALDIQVPKTKGDGLKGHLFEWNKVDVNENKREKKIPMARLAEKLSSSQSLARPEAKDQDDETDSDGVDELQADNGDGEVEGETTRAFRILRRKPATAEPPKAVSLLSLADPQFHEVSTLHSLAEHFSIDCEVDEWTEWSPCSQTCGFGKRERSRKVLTVPQRGGRVCPPLTHETVCGSMRSCQWQHFSFLQGNKPRGRMREGRTRRRRN